MLLLLLIFCESTGGILTIQQLFNSMKKVRTGDLKMAAVSHLYDGRVALRETKADSVSLYRVTVRLRQNVRCRTREK